MRGIWTGKPYSFQGKHYRIDQPINEPKGVRKPHPSFWIGGGGEKVTLKLVAQYADGANFGNGNPEMIREKLAILKQHCEKQERDYARIIKSTSYNVDLADSTATNIAKLEKIAEAGADYAIVYFPRVAYDHEPLLRFQEEVIPHFL